MIIKFIKPSYEIDMLGQTGIEKLKQIEKVARLCYKTEDRITDTSYEGLIKRLVDKNHTAMLEHASFAVKFICSRDFSHELVRHRIASFAQESQRYVGYNGGMEFIIPSWCDIEPFEIEYPDDGRSSKMHDTLFNILGGNDGAYIWAYSCISTARHYYQLTQEGWRPEQARSVLPNSTKTEIWINTNLRSWMNVFSLRDANAAAPAMRELMNPLHKDIIKEIPIIFGS